MTHTYLVRRGSVAATAGELHAALTRLRSLEQLPHPTLRARWLHSYALREADGRFGLACVLEADDVDAVRLHALLADPAVQDIVAVQATRVMRSFAPTLVYLVRRHDVARNAAQFEGRMAAARRIAEEDMPRQVVWLRSYTLREHGGEFGTACLFQATDPGALREHAARAGLPVGEITPVFGRLVFREDPDSAQPSPDQAVPA